jgi:hypothetical protein
MYALTSILHIYGRSICIMQYIKTFYNKFLDILLLAIRSIDWRHKLLIVQRENDYCDYGNKNSLQHFVLIPSFPKFYSFLISKTASWCKWRRVSWYLYLSASKLPSVCLQDLKVFYKILKKPFFSIFRVKNIFVPWTWRSHRDVSDDLLTSLHVFTQQLPAYTSSHSNYQPTCLHTASTSLHVSHRSYQPTRLHTATTSLHVFTQQLPAYTSSHSNYQPTRLHTASTSLHVFTRQLPAYTSSHSNYQPTRLHTATTSLHVFTPQLPAYTSSHGNYQPTRLHTATTSLHVFTPQLPAYTSSHRSYQPTLLHTATTSLHVFTQQLPAYTTSHSSYQPTHLHTAATGLHVSHRRS